MANSNADKNRNHLGSTEFEYCLLFLWNNIRKENGRRKKVGRHLLLSLLRKGWGAKTYSPWISSHGTYKQKWSALCRKTDCFTMWVVFEPDFMPICSQLFFGGFLNFSKHVVVNWIVVRHASDYYILLCYFALRWKMIISTWKTVHYSNHIVYWQLIKQSENINGWDYFSFL